MKEWTKERCSELPEESQLISSDTYIERRNIVAVDHEETDTMAAYTDYECESREISVTEYNMLKSIEAIDNQKAVDDFTMQLIEEGLL